MSLSKIMYTTLRPAVSLYTYANFNTVVEENQLKNYDGPVFFIGNHVAVEDPIVTMLYTNRNISYLAASSNFDNKFKKFFFNIFDIVSFKKGQMDVKALKTLKKYVDAGKSVGLYPEGTRTWDGSDIPVIDATAKLVKFLKIPVYCVLLKGYYLTEPRWGSKRRKGKTFVEIVKILDVDEIKKMHTDEILEVIKERIKHNDYVWQRKKRIAFKSLNRAEYIERAIYKCPECGAVDSFFSKRNQFDCKSCGKNYFVDVYGFIQNCKQFDNVHDWNVWQSTFTEEIIENNLPFINEQIEYDIVKKGSYTQHKGKIIFDKQEIIIDDMKFSINEIESPTSIFSDTVEFYVKGTKYRIRFNREKHTSVLLIESILKKMVASTVAN